MRTFDLTKSISEHVLQRHECDFFYYYLTNEPANNKDNVVFVDFG